MNTIIQSVYAYCYQRSDASESEKKMAVLLLSACVLMPLACLLIV